MLYGLTVNRYTGLMDERRDNFPKVRQCVPACWTVATCPTCGNQLPPYGRSVPLEMVIPACCDEARINPAVNPRHLWNEEEAVSWSGAGDDSAPRLAGALNGDGFPVQGPRTPLSDAVLDDAMEHLREEARTQRRVAREVAAAWDAQFNGQETL